MYKYRVLFICFDDPNNHLRQETNDYDQAEHFFWAMVVKLTKDHETDVHSWQLTLTFQHEEVDKEMHKLHFSKH